MATRGVEALIKPELLVWARNSSGLSLEDAARKLSVKPERLQEWEAGTSRPTVVQLRNAANVYRRPLLVFYLPEPPRIFSVPHDYRTMADRPRAGASPELLIELRRARFLREMALDLAESDQDTVFPLLGMSKVSDSTESIARKVREQLGISIAQQTEWRETQNGPFNGWRAAVEQLNVLVLQTEKVSVEETRGFSMPHREFPIVAVNGKDSSTARVFSLFHEFGHLLLNEESLCDLHEGGRAATHDQKVERFCNEFAASLLLPANDLREMMKISSHGRPRKWTPAELAQPAEFFGVSKEVVHRRLVSLEHSTFENFMLMREILRQEHEVRLRIEAEKLKQKEKKGGPSPSLMAIRKVGPAFARLAFDAFDRQDVTTSDLAEYFGVRTKHLPRIRELAFVQYGEGVLN